MKPMLILWLVVVFTTGAFAQQPEAIDGALAPVPPTAVWPGQRIAPDIDADLFELPPTRQPPIRQADDGDSGSFFVAGYVAAAPEGILDDPDWTETPDGGRVYAVELTSDGAEALRVRLDGEFGGDDLELRIYDPAGGSAFGPVRLPMRDEEGMWWSHIIFGESIGLEFHVPPGREPPVELPIVREIAYIYEPPPPLGGPLSGCPHRDVTCEPGWATQANAVTMLSTIMSGNVVGYCSGALLNRGPGDLSPLVMTANHCVGGQRNAGRTVFVWQFETPTCDGTPPDPNTLPQSNGSLLLKRHLASDWNLLGLYEPPGASAYLGWSSFYWDDDSAATGIHHPGGTFKRISFGTKTDDYEQPFCDDNDVCFDAEIWEIQYDIGGTQGGSSGSPVMDTARRVRGTLTGGPEDDCQVSKYGRLDLAMDFLRYYLSNTYIARPCYVDGRRGGDPGNHGNSERGTPSLPFNTVHEATFAVVAGDNLHIYGGNYNERLTIRRPMTLRRWGSGVVRIGE